LGAIKALQRRQLHRESGRRDHGRDWGRNGGGQNLALFKLHLGFYCAGTKALSSFDGPRHHPPEPDKAPPQLWELAGAPFQNYIRAFDLFMRAWTRADGLIFKAAGRFIRGLQIWGLVGAALFGVGASARKAWRFRKRDSPERTALISTS